MKHTFKNALLTLVMALVTLAASAAKADDMLNKAVAKITSAPSITFKFSATDAAGGSVTGSLVMSKKKFVYDTKPMKVWFDGVAQYTLSEATREVNITQPTAEEILESNPLALISGYHKNFTAKIVSSSKGMCTVRLTPKNKKQSIKSADITINTRTYMPVVMTADFGGSQKVSIAVSAATIGKTLPANTFTFNKKSYPGYKVVDLR